MFLLLPQLFVIRQQEQRMAHCIFETGRARHEVDAGSLIPVRVDNVLDRPDDPVDQDRVRVP